MAICSESPSLTTCRPPTDPPLKTMDVHSFRPNKHRYCIILLWAAGGRAGDIHKMVYRTISIKGGDKMSDPVYTIEQRARDGTLLSRMVGRYNRKTQTVEPVSVKYFVDEKARENHKKLYSAD